MLKLSKRFKNKSARALPVAAKLKDGHSTWCHRVVHEIKFWGAESMGTEAEASLPAVPPAADSPIPGPPSPLLYRVTLHVPRTRPWPLPGPNVANSSFQNHFFLLFCLGESHCCYATVLLSSRWCRPPKRSPFLLFLCFCSHLMWLRSLCKLVDCICVCFLTRVVGVIRRPSRFPISIFFPFFSRGAQCQRPVIYGDAQLRPSSFKRFSRNLAFL